MGRLASEGFLERIPLRGFRVPKESISDLIDLYPIIGALEILAARLAFPRIDKDTLAQLRKINRGYEEAKRRKDIRAGIELNDQFHHLLSEKPGNRRLCELLDELPTQVRRLEIWAFSDCFEDWDGSIAEHEEILRAIENVFKVFDRYTKVVAPNGKPIHIVIEEGYTDEQAVHSRRVLVQHLSNSCPFP